MNKAIQPILRPEFQTAPLTERGSAHAARVADYQTAMKAWQARADEAKQKIRLRLEDTFWEPMTWRALGIDPPPTPPSHFYL